jgi:hypothetical protein
MQYIVAIVLSVTLGAILGSFQLFKRAGIGTEGLTASHVVQFLGYGGAVLLLWLLARAVARQISEDEKGLSFVRHVVEPLAAFIAVSVGHNVLLLVVGPFLGKIGTTFYNWIFVFAIVGAALWLVVAGQRGSESLLKVFAARREPGSSISSKTAPACPHCGAAIGARMKFCAQCGESLASVVCDRCGQVLTPGAKFCGSCGRAVG